MNICFICGEYPPALHGGIGAVIRTTARALVQYGHNVRVIGVYAQSEEASDYEEDEGVQVWRLRRPPQRLGWIIARYKLFLAVRAWAKKKEIDVVEAPDWEGYTALWPSLDVPVVVRLHGSSAYFAAEMAQSASSGASWLERRAFQGADECSSCSSYTARRTSEIFNSRPKLTSILYNSVALSKATDEVVRSQNNVVFAGTLTRKKGIIQLIKAWPQVHTLNPQAQLHVYGKDAGMDDGTPMIPYLESLLSGAVHDSVRFHGHVTIEQLRSLYQHCSLAVFPSYAEAFAVAPLEAMAEGCPVICANRSSGPELIHDGVNGLLVDPDDQAQIAQSILRLLDDKSLAWQLGIAGRRTIEERFSVDYIVRQFAEFYAGCIQRFHRNGPQSRLHTGVAAS